MATASRRDHAERPGADAAVHAAGGERLRAAIYARVSRDLRNGRSVRQQETDGRAHVDREDWDLVGVWVDNDRGASQWSKGTREQWEDLKDQVAAGAIDILVVWEPSRLTRDRLVWATLAAICEREGVKIAASGRVYDLSDPDDAFQLDLYFALATREVGVTRKRVIRDTKAQAEKGHPHGGIAYGYYRLYDATSGNLIKQVPDYRRRLNVWGVNFVLWLAMVGCGLDQWCTPLGRWALGYRVWEPAGTSDRKVTKKKLRPPWWALGPLFTPENHRIEWYTRADIVTEVLFPRSLAGDPEFVICRELSQRGILTSTLSLWEPVTLRYLLANPTYAGLRRYQGHLYPAKWPALVSLDDHQALAARHGRGTWEGKKPSAVDREHTVKYLLSGLLTCGVCEGPCNTAMSGPRRYYTCIGRGRIPGRSHCTARPLADVDLYVTELIIEWLCSPEAAKALMVDARSAIDVRTLMDRCDDIQEQLEDLYKNAGLNGMSAALLGAIEKNLLGELETASKKLKARQRYPVLRDLVKPDRADVEAAWDRLADNLPRRREVVRTLFTRLELKKVGRGRRGVPIEETVEVTWRDFDAED